MQENNFRVIEIAVIIAIVLGLSTSIFFMMVNKEYYSAIYIVPGSIIQNPDDKSVLYSYGVWSSESGKMNYTLDTYLEDKPIKTRQFSLNPGEILEEREKVLLPSDVQYPSKIRLVLTTVTATEEVHFWLK